MAYAFELITRPNTAIVSPVSQPIEIRSSIITKVIIIQPTGCVGLVGTRFTYQSHRLWPINEQSWFKANGTPIIFEPNSELTEPPFELTMECYNIDDTYQHIVYAYVEVEFIALRKRSALKQIGDIIGGFGIPQRG